jgi:hypothetical protein
MIQIPSFTCCCYNVWQKSGNGLDDPRRKKNPLEFENFGAKHLQGTATAMPSEQCRGQEPAGKQPLFFLSAS